MKVYFDHAAATPTDPRVKKEIESNYQFFGNPSSLHSEGEKAKKLVEESRKKIAGILKVKPDEIIFTSSGTESVNLAIFGIARANQPKFSGENFKQVNKKLGRHIITSNIEHLAVLNSCERLEKDGFNVTYLRADKDGIINLKDIEKNLRENSVLVSIMHANNEIGTIQPIREISHAISNFRKKTGSSYPYFHTDACQTAGALNVRPHDLGVDLLTINGSKIYGPKGIGCLFIRRGVKIKSIIYGGSQEKGLRAGTENVSGITGLAKALEIVDAEREKNFRKETELRDYTIKKVLEKIQDSRLNGHFYKRLPNNINISFKDVDGEMLMLYLNERGICVSTGSACTTSESGLSHVIKAIGGNSKWGNIRITLGKNTTKKEIDYFIRILPPIIKQLRNL